MKGNYILLFLVFWPIIGSFITYIIGRKNKHMRNIFAIFVTALEFLVMISLYPTLESQISFQWTGFAGSRLYFKLDGFRFIYGTITSFMWLCTTIFSKEYFAHYRNRNRYYLFMLMTLGATMGVLLSSDLLTTFILFEVMSFTSYVMVIHDEKDQSREAADTYIAVAVIGGLVMLMGVFLIKYHLGTTDFDEIHRIMLNFNGPKGQIYLAAMLLMVGFGGKAGMFPIHIWLPNAHPSAPAPASALLSGILTKTGIFGAIVISSNLFLYDAIWGIGILLFGLITMFIGAFLALFSIDLKRTLAYSSVSQIGFILIGLAMEGILGEHNALAIRGALLHMVNHSLIKLVLFMAAGVVYMNLHELNLNKIRGFGKKKPFLLFVFLMGVLSIIGMPLWSGYVSKTLLHESIVEKIWLFEAYSSEARFYQVVEGIFILTGGFTTAYMTKIFVALFIEKNPYSQDKHHTYNGKYISKLGMLAIGVPAILLFVFGAFPGIMDFIGKLGQEFFFGHDPAHEVHYFAWINLRGALASLLIGAIVYILVIRGYLMTKDENGNSIYINPWPKYLDIENYIYRPTLNTILPTIGEFIAKTIGNIVTFIGSLEYGIFKSVDKIYNESVDNKDKGKPNGKLDKLLNQIMPNTLSSSLIQFTAGLVIILIIVLLGAF